MSTSYVQQCPTCGRSLAVQVAYLGMTVVCQHCGGAFTAEDPTIVGLDRPHHTDDLLARANALINLAEAQHHQRPC